MKATKRASNRLNVRSDRGNVLKPTPRYSSGFVREATGSYAPISDDDVIAAALRIAAERMAAGTALSNPRATREYLALHFAGMEHEVFACLFLTTRNRLIACEELFRGTIDGASVHPREVVKKALAHNHPSGIAEPSQADELITRRLKEALALADIRVLDHLVIGGATVESFAERGLLKCCETPQHQAHAFALTERLRAQPLCANRTIISRQAASLSRRCFALTCIASLRLHCLERIVRVGRRGGRAPRSYRLRRSCGGWLSRADAGDLRII